MSKDPSTATVYEYLNLIDEKEKVQNKKQVLKFNLAKYMIEQQKAENNANILELLLA